MRRTGDPHFPYAELLDGSWRVVRVNAFPDHPLYTVLVDGRFDADHEDTVWQVDGPPLTPEERRAALDPVRGLTAYRSESGEPCDCWYC